MSDESNDDKAEVNTKSESTNTWLGSQTLLPGLVLIALGIIFLLSNLAGIRLTNWWAVFILIPAFNSFSIGLAMYRHSGKFGRRVRGRFFSAFFFVLLSLAFFINADFSIIWPVFLILGGLRFLLGAL